MREDPTSKRFIIHTDGAARGNPGPAGIGVAIYDSSGAVVQEVAKAIGHATNNRAEYLALIAGLEAALKLGAENVAVRSDSELIVKQLKGQYAVRSTDLRPLFERAASLLRRFSVHSISHIPREQNRLADSLANKAIDQKLP